jgi:hypothetical protein
MQSHRTGNAPRPFVLVTRRAIASIKLREVRLALRVPGE